MEDFRALDKSHYLHLRNMSNIDTLSLVEEFKSSSDGVLWTVMGSRLSEGYDYPSKSLEVMVIVGLPFPPPDAKTMALHHFYERKYGYGQGFKRAFVIPMVRTLRQAMGRVLRSPDDYGAILVLDKRFARYRHYFTDWTIRVSVNPSVEIERFLVMKWSQ